MCSLYYIILYSILYIYVYYVHICMWILLREVRMGVLTRPTCACVCARVCVCDRAPTHPRRNVRAPSRRRRPRVARRAGVLLGVGVQREHRRVEHRRGHHVVPGMRRLRPGRRATAGGRVLGTAARRNAGMYVQTYIYIHTDISYMSRYVCCDCLSCYLVRESQSSCAALSWRCWLRTHSFVGGKRN